jgi:diguanylate cyclase (GGDEF)-like protein
VPFDEYPDEELEAIAAGSVATSREPVATSREPVATPPNLSAYSEADLVGIAGDLAAPEAEPEPEPTGIGARLAKMGQKASQGIRRVLGGFDTKGVVAKEIGPPEEEFDTFPQAEIAPGPAGELEELTAAEIGAGQVRTNIPEFVAPAIETQEDIDALDENVANLFREHMRESGLRVGAEAAKAGATTAMGVGGLLDWIGTELPAKSKLIARDLVNLPERLARSITGIQYPQSGSRTDQAINWANRKRLKVFAPKTLELLDEQRQELAERGENAFQYAGRVWYDEGAERLALLEDAFPTPKFKEGWNSPEYWVRTFTRAFTSLSQAYVLGGGTAGGTAFAGAAMEAGPLYEELKAAGDPKAGEKAAAFALAVAGMERLSFGKMFKGASGRKIRALGASMLTEATTEWAEEPIEAIIRYYDERGITPTEFGARVLQAMKDGLEVIPGAALTGGGVTVATQAQQTELEQQLKEQGLMPEDAAPPIAPEEAAEPVTEEEIEQELSEYKPFEQMTEEEKFVAIMRDDLTGLPNRRAFYTSERKGHVGFVDLQGLKAVNNEYGHLVGDEIIQRAADALNDAFPEGSAYRSNVRGDEFWVEDVDQKSLDKKISNMRQYLKNNPVEVTMPDGTVKPLRVEIHYAEGETIEDADLRKNIVAAEGTERGEPAGIPEAEPRDIAERERAIAPVEEVAAAAEVERLPVEPTAPDVGISPERGTEAGKAGARSPAQVAVFEEARRKAAPADENLAELRRFARDVNTPDATEPLRVEILEAIPRWRRKSLKRTQAEGRGKNWEDVLAEAIRLGVLPEGTTDPSLLQPLLTGRQATVGSLEATRIDQIEDQADTELFNRMRADMLAGNAIPDEVIEENPDVYDAALAASEVDPDTLIPVAADVNFPFGANLFEQDPIVEGVAEPESRYEIRRTEGGYGYRIVDNQTGLDVKVFPASPLNKDPLGRPAAAKARAETELANLQAEEQAAMQGIPPDTARAITEGETVYHEMPDGTIMPGPEHAGAVPGSEFTVDKDIMAKDPILTDTQAEIENEEPGPEQMEETIERAAAARRQGGYISTSREQPFKFEDETLEKIHQESKGLPEQSFLARTMEGLRAIRRGFTRTYKALPRTEFFANAHVALRRLQAAPEAIRQKAQRTYLNYITSEMENPTDYDIFERHVLLADLANDVEKQKALPNGWTAENIESELERLDNAMTEDVQRALARRIEVHSQIQNELVRWGIISEETIAENPNYFHHQVLDYAQGKVKGIGRRFRPTRGGYAKQRMGTLRRINTDYLQAEGEFIMQALRDIRAQELLQDITLAYDRMQEVRDRAREDRVSIAEAAMDLPYDEKETEGYVPWQPIEGNIFYTAMSVPERAVATAIEQNTGIPVNALREVLALGSKRKTLIIPVELAETLDNLNLLRDTEGMDRAVRSIVKGWKVWQLISPRRALKYNLNNFSGDLDGIIFADPGVLKEVSPAINELVQGYVLEGSISPDLQGAVEDGVAGGGFSAAEIQEIRDLPQFKAIRKGVKLKNPMRWYFGKTRAATQFREDILRLAAYKYYKKAIARGENVHGVSKWETIEGITDPQARAGQLARDAVLDYGDVSEMGQWLRTRLIPFYSFQELNFRRYLNGFRNASREGRLLAQSAKSPFMAFGVVFRQILLKPLRALFWVGMLQLWNNLRFPEEEKDMSLDDRLQTHLILGRDENNQVLTVRAQGAFDDVMGWFGGHAIVPAVKDLMDNRATWREVVAQIAEEPLNKLANSVGGPGKMVVETLAQKQFYPSVLDPRTIHDRGRFIAKSFQLENEYDLLTKRALRGQGTRWQRYLQSWKQAAFYAYDQDEAAYWKVQKLKREFLERNFDQKSDFADFSRKSRFLYKYKLALRYQDYEALVEATEELKLFVQTGQLDPKRALLSAMKSLDPMSGLSRSRRTLFLASLKPREREWVNGANRFYASTLKPPPKKGRKNRAEDVMEP